MVKIHSLGFPRIGKKRETKFLVESFWKGEINEKELLARAKQIRQDNWRLQAEVGLDILPVGDFSLYDHVLDMSALLGVIPERYQFKGDNVDLTTYFAMARGDAKTEKSVRACEMTKWFDTNYHYIVPEITPNQNFKISSTKLFDEIKEAHELGYKVKPILLGPVSYLYLSKTTESFNKLDLLPKLLKTYQEILQKLAQANIEWVQLDEPILVLDLPNEWRDALTTAYNTLKTDKPKILLATYFGGLDENRELAFKLPVAGIHLDLVRAPEQLSHLDGLRQDCILSLGIVNGRNVWKTNLKEKIALLKPIHDKLQDRLWISGSCSFLHSPVDLENETKLDAEIKSWLAFAKQKTQELVVIANELNNKNSNKALLSQNETDMKLKLESPRIHKPKVKERCILLKEAEKARSPFAKRKSLQQKILNLPLLPTTTIGSFPQTQELRKLRLDLKKGVLTPEQYEESIKKEIQYVINKQIELDLDVLVHGEPERNDMVEYFGEQLDGYAFSDHGWVQSYGSRCVKPPIIYGDVSRPAPMTVRWSQYAQSLTDKPVKGMLTGPVTMVLWSFVRDDQPLYQTILQVALALRDEVKDLEDAGIKVIQIDEPAFREGLPLRQKNWAAYLNAAVSSFKLTANCVDDSTQIHTHMCYSEFNDIIDSIGEMDADVIAIETSRSNMELLEAFEHYNYPNDIGPGVYDIHSPRIPSHKEMFDLIDKAQKHIAIEQIWINPDCGLKTRTWEEANAALKNMVDAAKELRREFSTVKTQ